jgi:transcription elongation factor GreA
MAGAHPARDHVGMTSMHIADGRPPPATASATRVAMTQTDYEALTRELEHRRGAHRAELAERLRDARTHGSPGDDDELLAVLEDVAVDQVRIGQLARLRDRATIVRGPRGADGIAGLGTVVRVRDAGGGTSEYELVGRRSRDSTRNQVSTGSPVGQALLGASRGDTVEVALPDGRTRALTVVQVSPAAAVERRRGLHEQAP